MDLETGVIWKRNWQNSEQMNRDLARARKADKNKKVFTMSDIEGDLPAVVSAGRRTYRIKQVRKEYDDESNGRNEPGQVMVAGNSSNWVPTGFAIGSSCKRIYASGEIVRDSLIKAGPDGIDDSVANHPIYQRVHGDKTTYLRGVRWGTLAGMVCDHPSEMRNCTAAFVEGSSIYLNADLAGREGYLWALPNPFAPKQTPAGVLTGTPVTDFSDNNLVGGEFRMNQETVSSDMCHR
ncbi:MAG: hypothetical protein KW804_00805 [Candidatus Doudnabacteria bacterium]|nr:hypothetical protein [Candidatus Doudnabacteria bacterium]